MRTIVPKTIKICTFILIMLIMVCGLNSQIVITEFIPNPSIVSDTNGEWIELFNNSVTDIDINGWSLSDNDLDDHVINNGGPLVIPALSFMVLARNTNSTQNGGVQADYQVTMVLTNTADELILKDQNGNLIDEIIYSSSDFPYAIGKSAELIDVYSDNNDPANWVVASANFGDGDFGTPRDYNSSGIPFSFNGNNYSNLSSALTAAGSNSSTITQVAPSLLGAVSILPANITLEINENVILLLGNNLTNEGTLINKGLISLNSSHQVTNNGSYTGTGEVDGQFLNSGSIKP